MVYTERMDETTAPAPVDNVPAIALRALATAVADGGLRLNAHVSAKLIELAGRCGITADPATIVATTARFTRP